MEIRVPTVTDGFEKCEVLCWVLIGALTYIYMSIYIYNYSKSNIFIDGRTDCLTDLLTGCLIYSDGRTRKGALRFFDRRAFVGVSDSVGDQVSGGSQRVSQ